MPKLDPIAFVCEPVEPIMTLSADLIDIIHLDPIYSQRFDVWL